MVSLDYNAMHKIIKSNSGKCRESLLEVEGDMGATKCAGIHHKGIICIVTLCTVCVIVVISIFRLDLYLFNLLLIIMNSL